MSSANEKVTYERKEWQEKVISRTLEKLGLGENPVSFYSPDVLEDFDFLSRVGFPGQYPFTAGNDAIPRWQAFAALMAKSQERYEWWGSVGKYAGF